MRASSATLAYEVVDVFTDRPFAGNPLAVVLDADDLDGAAMQQLAAEFGLSETAFPLVPTGGADYRLRIFTPTVELPFAGHPSVGAAWVLHRLGRLIGGGPQASSVQASSVQGSSVQGSFVQGSFVQGSFVQGSFVQGSFVQECGAGLLPVRVSSDEVELGGGPPSCGPALDPAPLLAAVGLSGEDVAGTPRRAGCGIDFTYLPVVPDAVARAVPGALRGLDLGTGLSVTAYADGEAHSRVFVPEVGVAEDPATGSAAVGLGAFLAGCGRLPDGRSAYVVRQGLEVGRPSTLRCTVTVEGGAAVATTVAGRVVPVARGEVRRP